MLNNRDIIISNLPQAGITSSVFLLFLSMMFVLASCDLNGNDEFEFEGQTQSYDLAAVDDSNVSGVAIFDEQEDGTTRITLDLTGTQSGAEHPAHIHANSVAEGGDIQISLNPVDGTTGRSETVVSTLDDDTAITYQELIGHDGHINVHMSEDDLETIVAQGDIGGNRLTGESFTYDLNEVDGSGVSGTLRFEERQNQNTLATMEMAGTEAGGNHPAHIHQNSVEEGGDAAFTLNNVDGETGGSVTNIRADQWQNGENMNYSNLLDYSGHVNITASDTDETVLSQGNIGANFQPAQSGN